MNNKEKRPPKPVYGKSRSGNYRPNAIDDNDDVDDWSLRLEEQVRQGKKVTGNSRKNQISINHLLEFQLYRDLPEYNQRYQHQNAHPRPKRGSQSRADRPKLHLHGMRFINMNYRFAVDHRKAYNAQRLDPNVPVDTEDIVRIIVPKGDACPICLSEDLVAPRMITSCGHVLCLTCLLSLLNSEVPKNMKRESEAVVEKYKDCPLCGLIIRKHNVKPVQIQNVDARFEIPRVGDDIVLTLMTRSASDPIPLPYFLESERHTFATFPWVHQTNPDLSQYSRIMVADANYMIKMYEDEKQEIAAQSDLDEDLYGSTNELAKLAFESIDEEIQSWSLKFHNELPETTISKQTGGANFFFYQSGFRASAVYVLSPLDMKLVRSSYGQEYSQLPPSVVAKVETIRFETLTEDLVTTKLKYLLHLPLGTAVGFLECNWLNNEYISAYSWDTFKADLTKRSKQLARKLRLEDQKKKQAMNEDELKIREILDQDGVQHSLGGFDSLNIASHELPALSSNVSHSESGDMQKTIWGTHIPKGDQPPEEDDEWDVLLQIQQQDQKGKKKKKKKLVLLQSGSVYS